MSCCKMPWRRFGAPASADTLDQVISSSILMEREFFSNWMGER